MVALAAAYRTPVPLFVAAPFGLTATLMWYQGTGRLGRRIRRRARRSDAGVDRSVGVGRATGEFTRQAGQRTRREGRTVPSSEPSQVEAYRALGLEPGADQQRVRTAYREKVKTTHPDTPGGDEEQFKRVTDAYERLSD